MRNVLQPSRYAISIPQAGHTMTYSAPDAAAALELTRMVSHRHAGDPDAGSAVFCFLGDPQRPLHRDDFLARTHPDAPTHLVTVRPRQPLMLGGTLGTRCGEVHELGDDAEFLSIRSQQGTACFGCRSLWSARFGAVARDVVMAA